MTSESAQYLTTLHKQIDSYFSFSEVKTLCFELGVDYENIPGDSRSAFIRNLIVSLARQNRLQELVDKVRAERGFVDWQDVPPDFELPPTIAQEDIRQVVQYNVYGDVVHGDKVGGDKVEGDKISVGNISNAEGIAIGGGASAHVQKNAPPAGETETAHPPRSADTPSPSAASVQQTADRLNRYLQMASDAHQDTAVALTNSIDIILAASANPKTDPLHLKLLCLGQARLADELAADIPGIEQIVAQFGTAVQQANI